MHVKEILRIKNKNRSIFHDFWLNFYLPKMQKIIAKRQQANRFKK